MTPEENGLFIADIEMLYGFVIQYDPAGAKAWLHDLPLSRVAPLERAFGVQRRDMLADISAYAELIIERHARLVEQAKLTTAQITALAVIRPDWKTWNFWIAVFSAVIAVIALIVAVLAYQRGGP